MSASDVRKPGGTTSTGRRPEAGQVGIASAAGLAGGPPEIGRPYVDRIEAVFRLFRHFSD